LALASNVADKPWSMNDLFCLGGRARPEAFAARTRPEADGGMTGRRVIATAIVAAIPIGLLALPVESLKVLGAHAPAFHRFWYLGFAPQLVSIYLAMMLAGRPPFGGPSGGYLFIWLACWPTSWLYVFACERVYRRITEFREAK